MHYRQFRFHALLLQGFLMAFSTAVATDLYADTDLKLSENVDIGTLAEKACCHTSCGKPCHDENCERGDEGDKGSRGKRGRHGRRGCRGRNGECYSANQINSALTVTNSEIIPLFDGSPMLVSFTSPIINAVNGINTAPVWGMSLVESVLGSGLYDTILLPPDETDTAYLVTFGVSVGVESQGTFTLVLNGEPLPYTALEYSFDYYGGLHDTTCVVVRPGSIVPGTLSIIVSNSLSLVPPTDADFVVPSFSATMTVVKLNNNHY